MTSRPFRFAAQVRALRDRTELRETARAVEALGYEELFSFDHVGQVDPFVPLMVAAEATTSLRVGPLVVDVELHSPALLARTAATVDRLTGGRLVLGLGTGYDEAEHRAAGLPIRAPGPRVDRFAEVLPVLRALLADGAAHHDGEHVRIDLDDLGIEPIQGRVPFLIGGNGPRVVRLAAEHADIFQFTGLVHGEAGRPGVGGFPIESVRRRSQWLDEAAGERRHEIERSALVQTVVRSNDADPYDSLTERFGLDAEVLASSPFVLAGSVDSICDELHRLCDDLGISHFVVREYEDFAPVVERLAG